MATQADLVGRVVQIIGAVVDIEFEHHLPEIYNAVRIVSETGATNPIDVVVEVEQHLGENRVRTIAMKPTDGMQRGMRAIDLGMPISVPVGPQTLGRVMNVLGEPVDFPDRPVQSVERWSIHRPPPDLEEAPNEHMNWESRKTGLPLSTTPFLQAHDFLRRHAPNKRLVLSGWGGVARRGHRRSSSATQGELPSRDAD